MKKPVFGTAEWAKYNYNFLIGCSHDCKYCYAKTRACRYKLKTSETWKDEGLAKGFNPDKKWNKKDGTIMFPTTHDITTGFINQSLDVLQKMLHAGNNVLIVSKPHLLCINILCDRLSNYKNQILFRFTIGSTDDKVLKYWEPNAPSFQERLDSLKYAFKAGYKTSVSSEPMLDSHIERVVAKTEKYITDSLWIGKANFLEMRLKQNGHPG